MSEKFEGYCVGQKVGEHLTIVGPSSCIKGRSAWCVECKCGRKFVCLSQALKRGKKKTCGECRKTKPGQVYGRLTVIKLNELNGRKACLCLCECGNEVTVLRRSIRTGATKSCGCLWKDICIANTQKKAGEFIGKCFKKWTVEGISPRRTASGGIYFTCRCECGEIREVTSDSLVGGKSRSCGICGARQKPECIQGHKVLDWGGRTPSGACKACVKEKSLLRNYGITLEEYAMLWQNQNGLCAICGKGLGKLFEIARAGFGRSGRAEVDHKHGRLNSKKENVRGLLCGGRWAGCNRKLGRIDNIEWLTKVIGYLKNPPAKEVLDKAKKI